MDRFFFIFLLTVLLSVSVGAMEEGECGVSQSKKEGAKILVYAIRNSTDDWMTTFRVKKSVNNSENGVIVDITQHTTDCEENQFVTIVGTVKVVTSGYNTDALVPGRSNQNVAVNNQTTPAECKEKKPEILKFNLKKGKNAVIVNDGRTAYRKDQISNPGVSALVTNRPLVDGELFQVQLDKIINRWRDAGVYIGVTLQPPFNIENRGSIKYGGNGTWSLVYNAIYLDGDMIKANYPMNLTNLQVGERIGVMRRSNHSLHFFLNEKDMGVAVKYLPGPVYGFFDLVNYAAQVSIVG